MRFFILILIIPIVNFAVSQTQVDILEKAESAYKASDWATSVKLYLQLCKSQPGEAKFWNRLATSYYQQGVYKNASQTYRQYLSMAQDPVGMYNAACTFALSGEKDTAWYWLDKATQSGWFTAAQVRKDTDLKPLHSRRFDDLVLSLDRAARPCEYDSLFRQFDFWIGEWDVFNIAGQKAGTNTIQKLTEGCLLFENWTGSLGGSGKSINFYDKQKKIWRQIWIASNGNVSEFYGQYSEGVMDFYGESALANVGIVKNRLRFFRIDSDTVRQLAERSDDNGKSWQVTYDFRYVRKK